MDQTNRNDEIDCWKSFQAGDLNSLQKLYESYFGRLYSYGHRFCPQTELVEDALQEFFMKLMRNCKNLAVPENVHAYLLGSFRMFLMDKLKQSNRRATIENTEWTPFEYGEWHDPLLTRELDEEKKHMLQQALNQLTDRQKEVIYLKYFEELPYPEIAQILDLSQKATYKLMGRAIAGLRENLSQRAMLPFLNLLFLFDENYLKGVG